MITQLIIDMFSALAAGVAGLLPDFSVPSWFTSGTNSISGSLSVVDGFANWMPLAAFRDGILFVSACMVTALAVKVARIAISLFTGGGGSAA